MTAKRSNQHRHTRQTLLLSSYRLKPLSERGCWLRFCRRLLWMSSKRTPLHTDAASDGGLKPWVTHVWLPRTCDSFLITLLTQSEGVSWAASTAGVHIAWLVTCRGTKPSACRLILFTFVLKYCQIRTDSLVMSIFTALSWHLTGTTCINFPCKLYLWLTWLPFWLCVIIVYLYRWWCRWQWEQCRCVWAYKLFFLLNLAVSYCSEWICLITYPPSPPRSSASTSPLPLLPVWF